MKALKILYADKKWIEKQCDISKIPIERVQTTIKDLVEINEAIAELEALQQPKSCEGCKYEHKDAYSLPCAACVRNCDSNYYEPKKEQ